MNATAEITAAPAHSAGHTRRTVANLAHVVGGEAMLRIANFVAALVIARLGGALAFGIYATALAYATVAAMLADNGLGIATVRHISADPLRLNHAYSEYATAKTLLFAPMVVALAAIGFAAHLSPLEWAIGTLIVLRTMLQGYSQMSVTVLKAIDRMRAIGPIQGAHAAMLVALLGVCYLERWSVIRVIAILVVAQSMELLLELFWIRRVLVHLVTVDLRDCWRLALSSTSVGLTTTLGTALMRLDVIVLSSLAGAAVGGVFAAAQSIIVIVYVLGSLLASVLFPQMACLARDPLEFRRYIVHWVTIILLVMVPGTLLAMVLGPSVIRALFGQSFAPSGTLLAIMLSAAPAVVLNLLFLHRAFALHMVRTYLGIYGVATVVALLLDAALAHSLAATGVALAVVIREYLILAAFFFCGSKFAEAVPDIV